VTVFATCDVDNPASAKVMEKAGMKYEGLFDVRGDENREIVGA
jgi:RimJ/RimL family protein N-acetyltransferase